MSDPSKTTKDKDEGKGVKRKNDGDAMLPIQKTQDSKDHQDERQQDKKKDNDIPMAGNSVASPKNLNDDEAKMKKDINGIIERNVDPRFRTEWDKLEPVVRELLIGQVLWACKKFKDGNTFEFQLTVFFRIIFEDDKGGLAKFISDVYNECVHNGFIVEGNEFNNRVASIMHGLDQEFLGTFDLQELDKQIRTVLKWHDGDYKDYRSPSFAMVQSSGMGKTKLMREYKEKCEQDKSCDIECKMILCTGKNREYLPDFYKLYDDELNLGRITTFKQSHADEIKFHLYEILRNSKKNKVIIFFDEAQNLLSEESDGGYSTIFWWLRQRFEEKAFVGVFAGTWLALSKFQRFYPPSGFSRDTEPCYMNYNAATEENLRLYDPFYLLTTISIARSHKIEDFADDLKDIRQYGCNGRPLFAAMLQRQGSATAPVLTLSDKNCGGDGVITNPTMYNILLRVLLAPNPDDWASNNDSIASVLGTRIQLGLANYDFVNKAVSNGYAMLVRYDTPKSEQDNMKKIGSVAIVFPPDPVCAAVAMGMMQPGWALRKNAVDAVIWGREPNFWVDKVARLFDQHIFLPNRGDSGEVFAALYMLLCGDVLRHNNDPYMRLFEVDLKEWLGELEHRKPENAKSPPETANAPKSPKFRPKSKDTAVRRSSRFEDKAQRKTIDMEGKMMVDEEAEQTNEAKVQGSMSSIDTTSCELTLNFIQVCRNYFRSHAWLGQSMLKYMYDTATGCYVFPLCPAIDIVFPIKRVNSKGVISYHPCLVSVKCWDCIQLSEMQSARNSMRDYLHDRRTKDGDQLTSALCLLLVIGTTSRPNELPQSDGTFPNQDTYISIVVPSNDMFGVNETIQNMAGASHISELLASHAYAYAEKDESALRVTATTQYRALGQRLLEDKQKLRKDHNETK